MGLLSIFKRRSDTATKPSSASESGDAVQRARTRARQRLIGAIVLVGIGIIGFPLVFETQPRPIAVDIPIEVPRKEGAPPLVMPAARPPGSNSSASAVQAPQSTTAAPINPTPNDVITETQDEAGRNSSGAQAAASAVAAPPAPAASKAISKPAAVAEAAKPTPEPKVAKASAEPKAAKASAEPPAATDSARAKSLLEGKSTPAAGGGRFVLQVGAFADASAAHDTRLKVEKLGMKTFTQVVSTSAGSRIRVRVGPFANRDEADSALAKARAAGLSAVVLTL